MLDEVCARVCGDVVAAECTVSALLGVEGLGSGLLALVVSAVVGVLVVACRSFATPPPQAGEEAGTISLVVPPTPRSLSAPNARPLSEADARQLHATPTTPTHNHDHGHSHGHKHSEPVLALDLDRLVDGDVTVRLVDQACDKELCLVLPMLLSALCRAPLVVERSSVFPLARAIAERAKRSTAVATALSFATASNFDGGLMKRACDDLTEQRNTLEFFCSSGLSAVGDCVTAPANVFHPLHPQMEVERVVVERVFKSKTKPLLLCLYTKSPNQQNGRLTPASVRGSDVGVDGEPHRAILKAGDDMRCDVAVLHIFEVMNTLWAREKLRHKQEPVRAYTYRCCSLSTNLGMCHFVPDITPLREFTKGLVQAEWRDRFVATAAAGYVAAFVLGVGDRHNDNILVSTHDNTLIHIDFGFLFGKGPLLDTGPFAVTKEMKLAMADEWDGFVKACCKAVHVLQKHHRVVQQAVLDAFGFQTDMDAVRAHVRKALFVREGANGEDEADLAAANKRLTSLLSHAPTNVKTRAKNAVHGTKMKFA